jgi:hypothetical protein
MARTYLQLINALRDRFNEPHITDATFDTVVGFNQYCKDAVNYAYHDILNAEMEWPFLHRDGSFLTVPGIQLYNVTSADEYTIKEIDWDSFFITPNRITTTETSEAHIILAADDYVITPTNSTIWASDLGVTYLISGLDFNAVDYDPQTTGQYTIRDGLYYFNSSDVNTLIRINYTTAANSTINNSPPVFLPLLAYDEWRQVRLITDYGASTAHGYGIPRNIFKTQRQGEVGVTPVPNQIQTVNFEYWVDGDDLLNSSDVTLLPVRYEQVLLDGAAKYCYEFREDTPLAKSAEERFLRGIGRMRVELINRGMDVRSGMRWRRTNWYTSFSSS